MPPGCCGQGSPGRSARFRPAPLLGATSRGFGRPPPLCFVFVPGGAGGVPRTVSTASGQRGQERQKPKERQERGPMALENPLHSAATHHQPGGLGPEVRAPSFRTVPGSSWSNYSHPRLPAVRESRPSKIAVAAFLPFAAPRRHRPGAFISAGAHLGRGGGVAGLAVTRAQPASVGRPSLGQALSKNTPHPPVGPALPSLGPGEPAKPSHPIIPPGGRISISAGTSGLSKPLMAWRGGAGRSPSLPLSLSVAPSHCPAAASFCQPRPGRSSITAVLETASSRKKEEKLSEQHSALRQDVCVAQRNHVHLPCERIDGTSFLASRK